MQLGNQIRLEILDEETAGLSSEKIAQCEIDGLHGRGPMQHIAADGEHYRHEGIKGEQRAGRHGEGIDVGLRFHQVMEGGTKAGPPGADIGKTQ